MTEPHPTNTLLRDPVAFEFFNEIGIIEQLSRARFERVLPDGMSLAQFGVLNHFVRLGGERTPSSLADAFQVTRGAMTNTLQRLEARGLVSIRADRQDGRSKLVTITDAGRQARQYALAALAPVVSDFLAAFPEERLADLIPPLAAVRRYLDENCPHPTDTA